MAVLFITAPAYAQGKVEVTVKKKLLYMSVKIKFA